MLLSSIQRHAIISSARRSSRTFPLQRVWRVIHVIEQLHEMAPQLWHHVGRVLDAQPARNVDGQAAHLHVLVIQRHEQRPQAAQRAAVRQRVAADVMLAEAAQATCWPV